MTEPTNTLQISFLELEITNKNVPIEEWFPQLEKKVGHTLPKYNQLEGGVWQNKDGTMECWPGHHYYICVPTTALPFLSEYGHYSYTVDQQVDSSTVNDQHEVFYWGPGCKPRLEPLYTYLYKNGKNGNNSDVNNE